MLTPAYRKPIHYTASRLATPNLWFALIFMSSLASCYAPLREWANLSLQDDRYSQMLLIPPVTLCLVYVKRQTLVSTARLYPSVGVPLLFVGIIIYGIVQWTSGLNSIDRLSVTVLAMVVLWIGAFVLCYGPESFHALLFPLLLLLLMVPIPISVMQMIILGLQKASAEVTFCVFKLLRVPVIWQGFKFSLPNVEIEIVQECSGIRSSMALLITGLLAGHLFLKSAWGRIALIVFTIPIAIFKNAVRIVTISCLGVYVDRSFLFGNLHRHGGFLFSLLGLAVLLSVLLAIQKVEIRHS